AFAFDLDTLLRLELFPVILLAGASGSEMRDMLLREESHPYSICHLPGPGSSWKAADEDRAVSFLVDCRQRRHIGILLAPESTLEEALGVLVSRVARRIHIIRPAGPLRTASGEPLPFYYTARQDRPELAEEDRPFAEMAERLLNNHPALHFSVATPWNLMEELFTVKGAGCVIRRGSIIDRHTDMTQVDRLRLLALLESSFGRKVKGEAFLAAIQEAYVEREYAGAALLEKTSSGAYLSKFAVGVEARGAGLAQELWEAMLKDHASLFWRARAANPVNQWYEKQSDGYFRSGDWRVFWRGVRAEDVSSMIRYSLERPEDFETTPRSDVFPSGGKGNEMFEQDMP
ncbi:MAG: hypothetical protein PHG65_11575, partial [Kiritimatiellae bacterium]|nr:hypothetical protein [Kiritimatiellia bacterium]